MTTPTYPLNQVLDVKKRRVEEAEKNVQLKKNALEQEKEKLRQREESRDKVKKHHTDKIFQLRFEMDQGTTSDKILQMKAYIKIVKENLNSEEKKVQEQKDQVKQAEKNLESAIADLNSKRLEVDKIEMHKKDWTKVVKKEFEINEEKDFNEQGSVIFTMHQKEKKRYDKSRQ